MGVCRFGYVVGFIPRHILVGCIGGVGWFLVATGFEVTARLDGNLNYDGKTLRKMFQADTVLLWLVPLILAIIYYTSSKKVSSKYYLPTYIMAIPALFYFWVFAIDELNIPDLKKNGWIFNGPDAGEPWWYFYTLYGMFCSLMADVLLLTLFRLQYCGLGSCLANRPRNVRSHFLRSLTCTHQHSCTRLQPRRRSRESQPRVNGTWGVKRSIRICWQYPKLSCLYEQRSFH